jgi:hypothetical protein
VAKKNGMLPTKTVEAVRRYADTDEAWVLFDRDGDDRDEDIRRALEEAAASKIEVGFSHPSFDLWLLLHFQPFSGAQSGSSKIVVEKLRSAPGADAFKNYDKRNDKSVKGRRRDALRGREKAAATNAKALVATCEHGDCKAGRAQVKPVERDAAAAPHLNGQRDPGTRRTASLWAVTRLLTSRVSWPRWASSTRELTS